MPQILLSPFDTDWFAAAFSTPALQFARQRCHLSPQLFPDERLCMMRQTLLSGNYQPQAPHQFELSRPNKTPRILTIPQPQDRLLQSAFARALASRVDLLLAPQSFAYRPKLSRVQALQAAAYCLQQGLCWVVRACIQTCCKKPWPA